MPPASQDGFESNYEAATGTQAVPGENGYFPIEVQQANDKWGSELRVYMPADQELELPPGVEVRSGNKPGIVRINNNQLWWRLVRMGFRLGTHHDAALIRANIPKAHQRDFDKGYEG